MLQALANSQDKDEILAKLGPEFLIKINDSSFLLDTVREVIEALKLDRVIFLFDEAAHTFIPTQQEIFFEMFKLTHGGRVAVKAAVYPTVTSYGRNFEVGQDALVISLDRFEPGATGRMPASLAPVVTGVLWSAWHLPLFFLGWSGESFMLFLLTLIGVSIVMAFAFNASGRRFSSSLLGWW